MHYVAFISYSHADSSVAKRLHAWLESYRIPERLVGRESPLGRVPRRLRPIFRDREELPTSADLGEQIGAALQASQCLIVICSPRAAQSRWVNEEILAFKRLGRAGRIVCLIVDGEPNASERPENAAAECFPPALRFHIAADGSLSTTPAEPIAADMRPGKDGKRDAWLKLAAGIAGVGFDELKQRELQRQLRRALALSAASTALLVTMAALALMAFLARQDAVRQRALATQERDRAEENFRDARAAVDRFYTKVSEEQLLKAEGLQPLRAELLGEALEYYRRFLLQRKDDPEFALEAAIVQGNVGGILSDVGDPEEALAAARAATSALEHLHRSLPDDPKVTNALSESLGNEAVNLDRLGRAEEALTAHTRAIELYNQLPADSPDRTPVELQRLLSTKGAFEAALGRFNDAADSYERSLAAADSAEKELAPLGIGLGPAAGGLVVVSVQPHSPADAAGLRAGDTITSIADVSLDDLARMADVRTRMKADDAMDVRLVRDGKPMQVAVTPVHLGNFLVASTKYNLGYLYLQRLRQPEKAKPWLVESVDEYHRALLRETSAAPHMREGLAYAAGVLGTCGYQLGDAELQERGMREGVAASEENVRANPRVPRYRTTLAINLSNLSTLMQRNGSLEEAAECSRKAAEHLQVALDRGGNLPSDRFQLFQVLLNLASITSELSGPESALPIYDAALRTAEPLRDRTDLPHPIEIPLAQLHRNHASSLRKTGRDKDALEAYERSSRLYQKAISEAPSAPVWLLEQAATLECWRASLLCGLDGEQATRRAIDAFEARCDALAALPDGASAALRARAAAVEAFADAVTRLLPANRPGGDAALGLADIQLKKVEAAGLAAADDPAVSQLVEETRMLVRGSRLRAGLCSDDPASAWRVFEDCLDAECLSKLPLEVRLHLAASLLSANEQVPLGIVMDSIRDEIDETPRVLGRIRIAIDDVGRCNVPGDLVRTMNEMLHLGSEPDEGR
jgi:tetratricopeptide (TPR) repeat protein